MRSTNIAIDAITKIEGSAGVEVVIEDDENPFEGQRMQAPEWGS